MLHPVHHLSTLLSILLFFPLQSSSSTLPHSLLRSSDPFIIPHCSSWLTICLFPSLFVILSFSVSLQFFSLCSISFELSVFWFLEVVKNVEGWKSSRWQEWLGWRDAKRWVLRFLSVSAAASWTNILINNNLLHLYSALHRRGESPQPPPMCSIHLDDATAAILHLSAHHTPAYWWRGDKVMKPICVWGLLGLLLTVETYSSDFLDDCIVVISRSCL